MSVPVPKHTYRPEYDALMDGAVHLIPCESAEAARRKAAALRVAARTRRVIPKAHILGSTVAFMATEEPVST